MFVLFEFLICDIFVCAKASGVLKGGFGVFKTPPKFRRYRWSPRTHEQEEPASRFPFV